MNCKKKNKHRQSKPPHPTSPQKQEVSEPAIPLEVANTGIECVVEERVPNIISVNVPTEVQEIEDTPKKPTRNRGKKKKDDDKSDKEDELKSQEPILAPEIQPIIATLDEANIAPTARKKKNKNKKNQGQTHESKEELEKVQTDPEFENISSQTKHETEINKEEPEQERKTAKKKNKKNKNRNDSERSDKAEELSCTSAFQKLLSDDAKVESIVQPSTDDSEISEGTVKEVEIVAQSDLRLDAPLKEMLQKDEGNKNKKKGKKDKKPQIVPDVEKSEDSIKCLETPAEKPGFSSRISEVTSEAITMETSQSQRIEKSLPSCSTLDEQSVKNNPTIAKPVEKKKKGKGNKTHEHRDLEHRQENIQDVKIESRENIEASENLTTVDLDDVILVPLTEETPDWQEEVKMQEGNGPVIGCEDKVETVALEKSHGSREKNKKSLKPLSKKIDTAEFSEILNEPSECKASSSAVKPMGKKPCETPDDEPNVKDDTEHLANRKKSPQPATRSKITPEFSISAIIEDALPESSSQSSEQIENIHEETQVDILRTEPVIKDPRLEEKTTQRQVPRNDKRKPRTESPLIKNEMVTSTELSFDVVVPELTPTVGVELPVTTTCTDTVLVENVDQNEEKKDGTTDRVQTPDSGKRGKRKKSPKPSSDNQSASGSKGSQKSKHNLKIEDIIIIQAEVVSEEKTQHGDTFVACTESTDKKDTIQTEVIHEGEKSKKRKKSPKPPQKESKHEINKEKDCFSDTQAEVQMPVTPKPQDIKLLPEVCAVELNTPKVDPIPSPDEITYDIIEYPRCSSEQLDINNNMVIQEIQHTETNLGVSVLIPETPSESGSKVIEMKIESKSGEEKTDLKSKVLEVNQDMEELQMSIERSLAELTSLEKSEKEAEIELGIAHTNIVELKQGTPVTENLRNQSGNAAGERKDESIHSETEVITPVSPARKEHKGKGKSKKKGKQEPTTQSSSAQSSVTNATENTTQPQDKNEGGKKSEQASGDTQGKEKPQSTDTKGNKDDDLSVDKNCVQNIPQDFEPIENFEDALTSSVDDVNKTFEMIVNEAETRLSGTQDHPEINVIAPQEDDNDSRQEKQNPVSPPKNLLGHPDIPVPSSRTDYKKEKNKPPNCRQAKVKIKDADQAKIETPGKCNDSSKSQTESKSQLSNFKKPAESTCVTNKNDDYVYKYSFRKVFLQCACHVCKKDLKPTRVSCSYCNLIFYCNQKHKDEDYSQHQALCFAVSTIVHLKDQKFIYADARNVTGHNYRLLRMQMIVSCEKVLKRRLAPWEQEALLYPRVCALPSCREWQQGKLEDCEACGQISYCSEHPDHLPKSHSRWCKSYNLYRGLVKYQQTKGRLEPKLPTKVLELKPLPENINEVLAAMYEEKIEMSDIEYAALTQLATAPLTALFCLQHRPNATNGFTKKCLTLHIVGAELQFEADVLNKWEVFLLHLLPHVEELRVVLVGPDLNPSNLPLDLLGKIRYCENCQRNKRRVVFGFQDKRTYHEFWASEDFTAPDLVCAFNPSIQRSSAYNGKDTWPASINCILKLKTPLAITSYTLSELTSDILRVQECATVGYNVLCAPRNNSFASVRPDRNFISDDEAPLLFKNHCVTVVCGV